MTTKSKPEVLYIIRLHFGDGRILCKVGRTNNLDKRLQEIKTAFPGPHEVAEQFDDIADGTAKYVESYVLAKLESYRNREGGGRELFDFTIFGSIISACTHVREIFWETIGMFESSVEWNIEEKIAVAAGWSSDPKVVPATKGVAENVRLLREKQAVAKAIELECSAIKDSLRVEFAKERASKFTLGPADAVSFTEVSTERVNTKRLREKYPDIAKEFTERTSSRRLNIGT
jgi:hypothetical protein